MGNTDIRGINNTESFRILNVGPNSQGIEGGYHVVGQTSDGRIVHKVVLNLHFAYQELEKYLGKERAKTVKVQLLR